VTRRALAVGERVRDGLGHWYEVLAAGDAVVRLQPLTWVGSPAALHAIGTPVNAYRSDLRADGE
jgi:hypothetical protein